jgi:hypothetical protein
VSSCPTHPPPPPTALLAQFSREEAALNTLVKWLVGQAGRLRGHLVHVLLGAEAAGAGLEVPPGLLLPFPLELLVRAGGGGCAGGVCGFGIQHNADAYHMVEGREKKSACMV